MKSDLKLIKFLFLILSNAKNFLFITKKCLFLTNAFIELCIQVTFFKRHCAKLHSIFNYMKMVGITITYNNISNDFHFGLWYTKNIFKDASAPNHEKMELNNTSTSHNEHESYATATMPTYLCFKLFSKIFGISD